MKTFGKYKFGEWMRDLTSLANPIILLLLPLCFLRWTPEYKMLLIALFINELVGSLIKFFFHKPRPDGQKYSNALEKIDAGSFPSLHSSRIAVVYLTLAYLAPNIGFRLLFLAVIIVVGYSRIFLKKHFLADVIGGYFFGGMVFLGLWWWMAFG